METRFPIETTSLPTKTMRIHASSSTGIQCVLKCPWNDPATVVPAQAGTHTPQQGDVAGPAITETLVVMGPRLRGDDSGLICAKDTL